MKKLRLRWLIMLMGVVFSNTTVNAQLGTCSTPHLINLDANESITFDSYDYATGSFFSVQHCSGAPSPQQDYVYRFTAPADGVLNLELYVPVASAQPQSSIEIIAVKTNCSSNNSGLIDCVSLNSSGEYTMMEGETYYLIVQSGIYPLFHYLEVSFSTVNLDNVAAPMPCGASASDPFFGNTANSTLNLFNSYDCQPDWPETGPEDVYKLETNGGDFYAYVGTSGNDLDIFLLRESDSGSGSLECVAYGDQVISTTIDGGIYYLVVDGYQGASGAYVLYVDCPEESTNCTEVPAFTTEEIGLFSASIGWTSTEEDILYTFQFREEGTSQWEEVICPISLSVSEGYGEPVFGSQLLGFACPLITVFPDRPIPSVSLGALKPGTTYEYRVNTTCFDNSTTAFSPVAVFTTESSTDPYTNENRFSASLSDKAIYPELLQFSGGEYEFEVCTNEDGCIGCGDSVGPHFEEGYEAIDDFTAQLYITESDVLINIAPDTSYYNYEALGLEGIDTMNLEGYLHIWVDYDEDLVFEPSELLVSSGLINSVEDFSASFGILGGEEGLKRMRIIFNTEQDAEPYGFYWSGFTLDMDVNISSSPTSCNVSSNDILCQPWVQNYLNTNYPCNDGQCGSINLYTSPAGECVVDFVGEQPCLLTVCESHEVFDLEGNLMASYVSCGLEPFGYTNWQPIWSCGESLPGCNDYITYTLYPELPQTPICTGESVCIPITVENFSNITGSSFGLQWNPDILSYEGVWNLNWMEVTGLGYGSFDLSNTGNGELMVDWETVPCNQAQPGSGITLDDCNGSCRPTIFEVCFNVVGGDGQNTSFNLLPGSYAYKDLGVCVEIPIGIQWETLEACGEGVTCAVDAEDVLCFPWVQDFIQSNSGFCGQICLGGSPYVTVRGYTNPLGETIIELASGCALVSESSSFYDCQGNLLETCQYDYGISQGCNDAFISSLSNGQQLWTCSQTPPECHNCPAEIEDILCMDWVQDTLTYYLPTAPDYCVPDDPLFGYGLSKYSYSGYEVFGIGWGGFDTWEIRYYDCSGNYLGINYNYDGAGGISEPADLPGYEYEETLWDCEDELPVCPDPVECNLSNEEILCLDWLNGIVVDLEINRCDDFACTAVGGVLGFSSVKIYATETGGEVIEVYWEECLDAERRLYSCEGELLASCTGLGCEITSLGNLTFQNDIWDCTQPLPNCTSPWPPQACASGNTHFINVIYEDLESEIDGQSLEEGDWLGLFYEHDDGTLVCMDQAQFTDPAQENGFQLRGCEESSPGADDGFALDEPFQFKVFKDGVEYEAGALSIAFWGEGEIIPPVFPDATSRFIGDGRQSAIRSIRDFPDIEDPSCDTPIPISCGQSHSGNNTDGTDNALSYNCFTNVVDGPEVIYTFTIDQTEDVLITLDGLSDDLELLLLDECDRDHCIAVSERTGASAETILYEDLEPGDYVIVVEGYIGFQSDYTLSLDCGDFPQGDFNCTPEEIGCNETISATTADGCSDVSFYNCSDSYMPGREKVYRIRFDQPENVRITLTPQGGDLELFLLDALDPNRCIYSSTESGDEIERILLDDNEIIPNRDYYIVVDEFNTNNGVDFQLQVQCVPDGPPCPWCPPPPGFCDNAEAITCGTTINGHTQNGDARVDKWGDCPSFNVGPELIYVFDNPVTQDVQVTLSGFTENLNFYILRDQCAVSACYEGWAGNKSGLITESILITPMPAGQYYIVVDSYDAASAFALEVKCQETDNCFELDVPAGYSYISSNRRPGDPTIENVLPSGQFQGLSLILSDEWGNIYDPNFPTPGAPNRIENWATTDGYRIDVSEPVTLEFCGEEAEPEASRVVIAQTATGEIQNNIIGYPFQGPMTVEETFAGSPTEGLSSIEYRYPNGSQASESYIFPLQLGTNFTMAPGNGYLLKVSQDGEFSFRSQEEASTFMPNGCTYFRTPLRNTMERAFIRVPISGVSGTMEVGDELGLFNEEGLLCGSGKYLGGQIIITLLGDENATAALEGFVPGEMMYAQIWSATTGKVKEVGLQFSESEAVYAHNQIYRLDDLSSTTRTQNHAALIWQLYPNPAGERLYLEYQLPDAQMISVRLIATNGQVKVQYEWNLESGVNRTSIELSQLPNGIYFVQLATDGATETKKIVVQH